MAPSTPPDLAKLVDSLVAAKREARPRSADVVRHALERIRSALAGHERALPAEERGPFPGLDKYEAEDRDVFFGRSAEIAGVIELLRTRGLVGIVGLSGNRKEQPHACGRGSRHRGRRPRRVAAEVQERASSRRARI